jgi:hypothetical protein
LARLGFGQNKLKSVKREVAKDRSSFGVDVESKLLEVKLAKSGKFDVSA